MDCSSLGSSQPCVLVSVLDWAKGLAPASGARSHGNGWDCADSDQASQVQGCQQEHSRNETASGVGSFVFSLASTLKRANAAAEQNGKSGCLGFTVVGAEPKSAAPPQTGGDLEPVGGHSTQLLKPSVVCAHLRRRSLESVTSVQTARSETSVATVRTLQTVHSKASACSSGSAQSLSDQGFSQKAENESEAMWRLVETLRNKSTILREQRRLQEKNLGGVLHMEIIEEDVVQEGFGTEFKVRRRAPLGQRQHFESGAGSGESGDYSKPHTGRGPASPHRCPFAGDEELDAESKDSSPLVALRCPSGCKLQ